MGAASGKAQFLGPVEVDEAFIGGSIRKMHGERWRKMREQIHYGKAVIAGMKDRRTNRIAAAVVESNDRVSLHAFVSGLTHPSAAVYTDDHTGVPPPAPGARLGQSFVWGVRGEPSPHERHGVFLGPC